MDDDASELLAEAEALSNVVAHELRSPLGAMVTFGSLLAKGSGAALDENGRELLARLNGCAREITCILDRLGVFAEARQRELAPVALNLGAEVRAAFDLQTERSGAGRPGLSIHAPDEVWADPTLLRLLLANLLSNAILATAGRPDALIEVGQHGPAAASTSGTPAGELVWFVRDNGIGFDGDQAVRLFQPFGRVHARTDDAGVGLGLAIVRSIARRHGGRAWAEGVPGVGATFYVALPRQPRQLASTARPTA